MPEAAVSDVPAACREHVLAEAAEQLHRVERGGAWASIARLAVGERDGAVVESHEATVGDGDPEARGSEVREGRVTIGPGLRVDISREVPDLWVDVLQQSGWSAGFLEDGPGDGGESSDRDQAGGSGGKPGGAVQGESTARDDGVNMGRVLELSSPGMQDAGKARQVRTEKTLVCGEALEGSRRGVAQGVVGEALRRAEEGASGLRDGEGEEQVWPGEWSVQGAVYPLRGFLLLPRRTVAVAAGGMDAGLWAPAWAWREAMPRGSALARLDRTDDLAG
jgi:hypothetical protein